MKLIFNNYKFFNYKTALMFLLVVVFVLHIPGLFYSFPLKNTVGDEVTTMSVIFKMMNDRSLRPDYASFYHLPITAYAQLPFYALLVLFLKFSGLFTDWEVLKNFVIFDYGYFLPFARFLTALFAVGAGYMMYVLTDKIFNNKKVALLASFLLSFNLMFFQVTHFARAWSLQILLLLITVYVYYDFFAKHKDRLRDYFVISFVTALSLGVHLASSLIYIIFLVLYFSNNSLKDLFIFNKTWFNRYKKFLYLHVFIIFWLLFFYYLNPTGFLIYLQQSGIENTSGINNLFSNFWFYTKVFFSYDLLVAILSIPAFILLYYKNKRIFFAFLIFVVIFSGSISYAVHSEPRFIVATMPFFIIPVSYFLVWLVDKVKKYWQRVLIYAFIILFVCYLPLLWTVKIIKPNTLLLARQFIFDNVPANSVITSSNAYMDIPENKASALFISSMNANANTVERRFIVDAPINLLKQPRYFVLPFQNFDESAFRFGDELKKVDYIIITFWNKAEQDRLLKYVAVFNKELVQHYYPASMDNLTDIANNMLRPFFTLKRVEKTGPFVEIYKVNN